MSAPTSPAPSQRLASIDAYRGLVMLLMLGEVLRFSRVSAALPDSGFWKFLAWHQSHVSWVGCSLHDLIQPSFSFLVGVALPFSLARRSTEGQPAFRVTLHAFGRALTLVLLGVFLRSIGHPQTYWTFEDTLSQIGLGYGFLFLVGRQSARWHWGGLGVILVGYWLAFALHPLPGVDFDWKQTGVEAGWTRNLSGFAAHWNKNTNFAWAFDTWWMNLFPREQVFTHNGGGYSTLSFIPTLGTMILGLIAGTVLRSERSPLARVRWLAVAGVIGLAGGWLLGAVGICPVVKRIWTPSWVLFSGGWCFLFLAAFYWAVDLKGWKRLAFPLVVVGMNSIAAYCSEWFCIGFIDSALKCHLGANFFGFLGTPYEPFLRGLATLVVIWLVLYAMYRKKIFLRI